EQQELRRLALGYVLIRLSEAPADVRLDVLGSERRRHAARSTRTALTLYSGVPMRESPTSWVSQLTFCSAKCSAIHTRPGKTRSVMCVRACRSPRRETSRAQSPSARPSAVASSAEISKNGSSCLSVIPDSRMVIVAEL